MHLRSPSIAPGTSAFTWALVFGLYVLLFMLGIGSSLAMSLLLGVVVYAASFIAVRTYGAQGRPRRATRA